jgi:hypothetical protein
LCYSSNVYTIWITADEAAICQTMWYVCLISIKEPKIISCPLWNIISYSDLQWMLLESVKPVTLNNRFKKNEKNYFCTSSCCIWYAWIIHIFCFSACSDNTYGRNCRETCGNCAQNAACDKRSGECLNGCGSSYRPPLCKISKYTVHIKTTLKNIHFQDISEDK